MRYHTEVGLVQLTEMRKTDCLERQDLSHTELAHHELESKSLIIIIIIYLLLSLMLPIHQYLT